jgi:glycosyltransferase involved in cell wall biosynthesis
VSAAGAKRTRVLFVGGTRYDLPLKPGLARKWDAIERVLELRVIGRAGSVHAADPRFRLVGTRLSLSGPAFYAVLASIVAVETRRFRPDVVIAQGPYEAYACLAAWTAIKGRPKLVVELHADWRTASRLYGPPWRRSLAKVADRAGLHAIKRADATRALSSFTARLAKEATGEEPAATFSAYIDLESFTAHASRPLPTRPAVVWVGVLERYKDPWTLAAAWRVAAPQVPEARLAVVGKGRLRPVIEELAREYPSRVRAIESLDAPQVSRLLDESTVLAMSSAAGSEGLPRVIMEAFSRGRPVIGTAAGGIPDLVRPEQNGLIVEPGHPEQLAHALVRALSDRSLAERLAAGALEDGRRAEWSPEAYASAVRRLVDRVLEPR